ncbi:unnamed protein product [Blepharisma stoltei]|uniref:EGF-like domain-containing protein n=1 Tax=Blepharisma stoltei TaxID=1481888 RepID=A0AAU9JZ09_9CILI|nr:unnamed protein product [Blepharisma stoltei]
MLVSFIYLLVLTLLTSSTREISPDIKASSKSTKIDSKQLLQDLNLPNQLFQDAMNSRKLKENATSDTSGSRYKRQLYSWCVDGEDRCLKCDASKTYCSVCINAGDLPNVYGGCSASSPPYCTIVGENSDCAVCSANHYLDCAPCSDFLEHCKECYSIDYCVECVDGYYENSNKCSSCSSKYLNCKTCNPTECSKCNSGFALDSDKKCVTWPTPNCIYVVNGICKKCEDVYYPNSNSCLSCSAFPNCKTCNSSYCLQCLTGFFQNGSSSCASCSSKIAYCLVCDWASFCTQCDSTHFVTDIGKCANSGPDNCRVVYDSDLSRCSQCLEGYNWDQNQKICKACGDIMLHCAECKVGNIEDFKCEKCDTGYILDPNEVCIKSPLINCKGGLDAYHCNKCFNFNAGVCISAGNPIANCKMASVDSSYCVDCVLGYSHTEEGLCECSAKDCTTCNTDDGSICDTCIDNHYGDCVACSTKIPNCDTCIGGICTKCSPGYYLYNSQCHLCTDFDVNCITCIDNDHFCDSCKPGFLPSFEGLCVESSKQTCKIEGMYGVCFKCLSGYYLNNQGTCSSCGAISVGCSTCSKTACLECSSGYWLNSNSCLPCTSISNCQTCINATECTKCEATYLLNENKKCTSSTIRNCDVVMSNNPSTCQQCSTGYFWDTTECKVCSVPLPNCDTCSSSTTCSLCKTGYYLDSNRCLACRNALNYCLECSSDCSSCLKCDTGYYPNHANKCIRSALNSCAKVSDDGMCITCPSDKIFACTNGGTSLPNCDMSSSDSSVCVKCKPFYESQGGTCVKICPQNCSDCSSKNICTICDSGYFLYDSNGKTTCISCVDSCTDCEPNPNCFICASLVVQDGSTCRVDSVGYEISFSDPFIIIDFAHSSSKILTLASLEAFTISNQNIATTNWFISSRSDSQLQIQTDNVRESDLPINLKISLR